MRRTYRRGYTVLDRHLHAESYLALVLSGGYEEAGDRGCLRVQAGDVLLHSAFEAHLDRYSACGGDVLNLTLPIGLRCRHVAMCVPDPDAIVRIAECDPQQALTYSLSAMQPVERGLDDWPHYLAVALERDLHLRLDVWASENHLAPAVVSRGFRKVFGISPSAYRAHQRARQAAHFAASSNKQLSDIAHGAGFSDQPHMTRAVHALTGTTPGAWRRRTISLLTI
jgi:AraC-like DNA-binding protein